MLYTIFFAQLCASDFCLLLQLIHCFLWSVVQWRVKKACGEKKSETFLRLKEKGRAALTTSQGPPPTSKHACICFGENRESNNLGS